jgi:hypothetical protein
MTVYHVHSARQLGKSRVGSNRVRKCGGDEEELFNGRAAKASLLLAERFPAVVPDVGGVVGAMHYYLVSQAERVNESTGRPFLSEPDTVATGFVESVARRKWRLAGGSEPGTERQQREAFDLLVYKLAAHMERRARDRAVNRREVPSSSDHHEGGLSVVARPGSSRRTLRGLPAAANDPAEAVVVHLDTVRVIRHVKQTLRSEAQRTFLSKLEKRPDLAHSLGVHGEWPFIAAELGISPMAARQLLSRIRAAVAALDADDAA